MAALDDGNLAVYSSVDLKELYKVEGHDDIVSCLGIQCSLLSFSALVVNKGCRSFYFDPLLNFIFFALVPSFVFDFWIH